MVVSTITQLHKREAIINLNAQNRSPPTHIPLFEPPMCNICISFASSVRCRLRRIMLSGFAMVRAKAYCGLDSAVAAPLRTGDACLAGDRAIAIRQFRLAASFADPRAVVLLRADLSPRISPLTQPIGRFRSLSSGDWASRSNNPGEVFSRRSEKRRFDLFPPPPPPPPHPITSQACSVTCLQRVFPLITCFVCKEPPHQTLVNQGASEGTTIQVLRYR